VRALNAWLWLPVLLGNAAAIGAEKPSVVLSFDHIVQPPSSRRALEPGLLYLRIKNTGRDVIAVLASPAEAGGEGVELVHEIIRNSSGSYRASDWISPPERYSPVSEATTINVQPNSDLLFSVPLNHVGPAWRLRVTYQLPRKSEGVADFSWADVPQQERSAWRNAAPK
jgi:hypothetical protein